MTEEPRLWLNEPLALLNNNKREDTKQKNKTLGSSS
jgi:hypothetical protein